VGGRGRKALTDKQKIMVSTKTRLMAYLGRRE